MLQKLYSSSLTYSNEILNMKDDPKHRAHDVASKNQHSEDVSDEASEEKGSDLVLSSQDIRNRKLQLIYIIKNLQEVHKNNINNLTSIINAQSELLKDNVIEAANYLQGILYDESADDSVKKIHNYIVHEARKILYNDIL